MTFKAGDKVKVCIGSGATLVRDKTYSVRHINGRYVYLFDVWGGWHHERFELVVDVPTARANDPSTSKGKRKVNKYEEAVLTYVGLFADERCPAAGMTGKEIALHSGHPLNCITPRFAPLRRKGLIKDSGIKRDKQIVWELQP